MNEPLLFPCWKKIIIGRDIPVYQRILFSGCGRVLMAFLSLVGGRATFTVRWEEFGVLVAPIDLQEARGIHTVSQLFTWAEWQVSALESGREPFKRAKKASKHVPLEKELA